MQPLISVRNVSKKYGNTPVLSSITFDLYPGEIITLLGPNGAGKTTLSSIIASLHPPTSGDVLFQGSSIYNNLSEYRFHIGLCPQKANFHDKLTVKEHLYFAGHYFLMEQATIKQQSEKLINLFGLQSYVDFFPQQLSGGYKQRLLLARALMHSPDLVILDEPTIALDPHIRRQLWEIIKTLKQDGITILLTTHYLDEAEVLSDRICVLDKGLLRLIDTPHNLLTSYKSKTLEDVFLKLIDDYNQ